jgi:hypothetical protein
MEKRSHLGMAGHHAAMAEFLYRGYNVAVPAVDIGDDVYVVEDHRGIMWRLQVKTSDRTTRQTRDRDGALVSTICSYRLSRRQLDQAKENELFFMFMVRWNDGWRFVLIEREQLRAIRLAFETADRSKHRGPKPSAGDGITDGLMLTLTWTRTDAVGWGASLADHLGRWSEQFPPIRGVTRAATTSDR